MGRNSGENFNLCEGIGNGMAAPERLELPTLGSEDRCSIQLSYGAIHSNFITTDARTASLVSKRFGRNTLHVEPKCMHLIVSHCLEGLRRHEFVQSAAVCVFSVADRARELSLRPITDTFGGKV